MEDPDMARSTFLAAGVLAAALTAGGAAGLILGTPSISGAQEGSTTTQDDGTTTAPDDGTTTPPADGERPEGCAEGGDRGTPPAAGEAPADEAPTTEGTATAST
jgi:hypothetical protein